MNGETVRSGFRTYWTTEIMPKAQFPFEMEYV